jgi:hypothetical protein
VHGLYSLPEFLIPPNKKEGEESNSHLMLFFLPVKLFSLAIFGMLLVPKAAIRKGERIVQMRIGECT